MSKETSARLDIKPNAIIALGVMSRTGVDQAKTLDRVAALVYEYGIIKGLIAIRDFRFYRRIRQTGTKIIKETASRAAEASELTMDCEINENVELALLKDGVGSWNLPQPQAVEFICSAENCCRAGLRQAVAITQATIQEGVSSYASEMDFRLPV